MSETQFVPYPTSKIVQFNVAPFCTAHVLCEDGSIWEFHNGKGYWLLSAPSSQPTEYDLDQALADFINVDVLKKNIAELVVALYGLYESHKSIAKPSEIQERLIYAIKILKKHGRIK
jgi:hypothetical protein